MSYIDLYDIHIRAVSWHNSWMLFHDSGPWLVNLWHRWCLGNMLLSLQPAGHDHGPHRAQVSPFLAEFLSDLVESQFPQSDGKVLHRSAQNGTGARKKCADAQMLVPSHARKTQLISQAARTCENTDFTTNITTWFPDCGQTLPWGGARPVSIRHFFLWNQVFYCTMEIDIAWHGPWLHFLLRFRSRWFVWSTFWPFLWSPVSAAGLRATRSSQKRSQNTWKSEGPHV